MIQRLAYSGIWSLTLQLGMSMRLAFDLGLHIDMRLYVKQGDISQREADVRRAAFWGSYVADQ